MAGDPLLFTVWRSWALEPSDAQVVPHDGLVLSRELLGPTDNRISRAPTAPRLRARDERSFVIAASASATSSVVVIPGCRFDDFQRDVPPATRAWKVGPAQLRESERVVLGSAPGQAIALMRGLRWDDASDPAWLMRVPAPVLVQPGTELELGVPATLLIGQSAVEVIGASTPAERVQPATARLATLELAPLWARLANPSLLRQLEAGAPGPGPADRFFIPGCKEPVPWCDVAGALAALLGERGTRGWCLLPACATPGGLRVLLAYEDARGAWRVLASGVDPAGWLQDLTLRLASGAGRTADKPTAPIVPPVRSSDGGNPNAELGRASTRNAATAAVFRRLRDVTDKDLTVLLLGESGTGKEFIAQQIHALSPRAEAPFVAVDCGALPRDLIASELFGHVAGSFTGAERERKGAFVSASGGTLLLDEIGDAPVEVQIGLLRVLETGRVKPVGSDREVPVDVRVLAATSRDIQALIASGAFRQDLYYRLADIGVRLPALRERPEDVLELAEELLARERQGLVLADDAKAALLGHPFPGNVRELGNAMKRAAALVGADGVVHAADLDLGGGRV